MDREAEGPNGVGVANKKCVYAFNADLWRLGEQTITLYLDGLSVCVCVWSLKKGVKFALTKH